MATKAELVKITPADLERLIHVVRGQRVMLDSDLARLYGVPTMVLNQAVKRNRNRFPLDFAYQLTKQEFADLISQIVISKTGRGGRQKLPWVFTEHGVAMLSSVLRSPTAIHVNIEIMRAFIRMRRLLATPGELIVQIQQLAQNVRIHDDKIREISDLIEQMLRPPEPPRGRFGFHPPEPSNNEPTKEPS